jgi:hypothetical protein
MAVAEYTLWNERFGRVSVSLNPQGTDVIGYLVQEKDASWTIEGDDPPVRYAGLEAAAEALIARQAGEEPPPPPISGSGPSPDHPAPPGRLGAGSTPIAWHDAVSVGEFAHRAIVFTATISCPRCRVSTTEMMPPNACQFFYACRGCGVVLRPKPGDCCVYCSYGDHPCPPVQMQRHWAGNPLQP